MGISPISFTNALATRSITPIYTVPVQPVHRIEGYSTHTPISDTANKEQSFEVTLNSYMDKYKNQSHIEMPTATPYEKALSASVSSAVVGMNFDMSV